MQEGDSTPGARGCQAARAGSCRGRAALQGEPLGEQMGRKMAAASGGACAITSSTIPTHTLAFGQSQGLKIATTSSSAISRPVSNIARSTWSRSKGPRDAVSCPRMQRGREPRGHTARWEGPGQGECWSRSLLCFLTRGPWQPLPAALAGPIPG